MPEHRGWHSRGYLPHFDEQGLVQSINFRLYDSLPKSKLLELETLLPKERVAERRQQIEAWLDQGSGSCLLRQPACARAVEFCLFHADGTKHRLLAWCVMPNHVHVLLQVLPGFPMDKTIGEIKGFSAKDINRLIGRSGPLWRPDYFDRFIHDRDHFANEVDYIEFNPVAAGLCKRPEDWPFSSAGWRRGGQPPSIE